MGRPEKLCATCALLRSQLDSLHARIRGLAVDCGAVQTEDAVEDVRKVVEGMRGVVEAAKWQEAACGNKEAYSKWWRATCDVDDAARRLAAARTDVVPASVALPAKGKGRKS